MTTTEQLHAWMAEQGTPWVEGLKSPVHFPLLLREDLYRLWARMGLKRGAEIGVLEGDNSLAILREIPDSILLCVDPWHTYGRYFDYTRQNRMDGFYETATQKLTPYVEAGRCHMMRTFSTEAARQVQDESLDFVYIDGNHDFDHCMEDIITWSRKVRPDGVVAGHDLYRTRHEWYGRERMSRMQVCDAVEAYVAAHRIHLYLSVGGGPKRSGAIPPSWMWVRPQEPRR